MVGVNMGLTIDGSFRACLHTVYLVHYAAVADDTERGLELTPSCAYEGSSDCRMLPSAIYSYIT